MKNPEAQHLIQGALKGNLAAHERADFQRRLQSDPHFAEDWRLEQGLEKALASLPDSPVSSNFTNLVLQATLRDPSAPPTSRPWFRRFFPRLASASAAALVIALLLLHNHQKAERLQLAETVQDFNNVASAFGTEQMPEMLANFDAIQGLNLPAESELDMELLVALQK